MPYPSSGYPFTLTVNGSSVGAYCQVSDVQARVLVWDPTQDSPSTTQVQTWIAEATAMMDSVLLKRGYKIPLAINASYTTISPSAYLILQNVCAAYVVHHVEQTRHGSTEENKDNNANEWLSYADDLIARFESGEDDLAPWGVDGAFEPELDPATGAQIGNTIDSTTGLAQTARFTPDSMSSF